MVRTGGKPEPVLGGALSVGGGADADVPVSGCTVEGLDAEPFVCSCEDDEGGMHDGGESAEDGAAAVSA